ncbi:NAD(P)H-hydrate dehydratase [Sphingomonas sp. SUN019]|uniref:NAD(P)H-hydrate dehydratase n=1 Tax=Sphingomonas sp. SUN019 TaxID=2937788 RepID=UPI0021640752|nr:NAD(P)H-hydrate dehydratase [Sphingomonas sp. SUN019]UVO49179.1 NAD(P)H-hydrate dehydratase [Sphingomonas sp. SUN019]
MIPLDGQYILTAAEMRAAEDAAIAEGASVRSLMARAGQAVAEAARRLAAGSEVLVLCGPGNNGGDGYVAASILQAAGHAVRVAATGEPRTDAARNARGGWSGPIETIADARPAPILVDALFGTGLSRGLDAALADQLHRLRGAARIAIAVDLPSGVATDDGALLSDVPTFDLTLALGATKPAHLLHPAAARMGEVRVLDIGVPTESAATVLAKPHLTQPAPDAHKYIRGMVAIVAGTMPGAAALAASAAANSGAGYVLLLGSATDRVPHAIVRRRYDAALLEDGRIGALLIGPGLGRGDTARERLDAALASTRPLVIDGDALHLLDPDTLPKRSAPTILTPHAGEFDALFGAGQESKIDRTRAAAARSGAIVVFKGADTVIADPSGPVRSAHKASPWLSTAGTGDVLAGLIAARLATSASPLDAATTGVWLHAEAARRAGPAFTADDLIQHLPKAIAACL